MEVIETGTVRIGPEPEEFTFGDLRSAIQSGSPAAMLALALSVPRARDVDACRAYLLGQPKDRLVWAVTRGMCGTPDGRLEPTVEFAIFGMPFSVAKREAQFEGVIDWMGVVWREYLRDDAYAYSGQGEPEADWWLDPSNAGSEGVYLGKSMMWRDVSPTQFADDLDEWNVPIFNVIYDWKMGLRSWPYMEHERFARLLHECTELLVSYLVGNDRIQSPYAPLSLSREEKVLVWRSTLRTHLMQSIFMKSEVIDA